jgi:hypothetical protein
MFVSTCRATQCDIQEKIPGQNNLRYLMLKWVDQAPLVFEVLKSGKY